MIEITLRGVTGLEGLETPWRTLESAAIGPGRFFRGWTWTGCLAAERFRDPVLLEGRDDARLVAIALFNRHRLPLAHDSLALGESGDPVRDAIFIEHNGILLADGYATAMAQCLAACLGSRPWRGGRAVVLSGVGDDVLSATSDLAAARHIRRSRPAPFVDLSALPPGEFPISLSPSTRYQLRRSRRRYAEQGALRVRRAADTSEALAFLDALSDLHQATWTARGRPGAFADPFFVRFHRELICRGLPRGEVDLLHIAAGERTIGYLYNFVADGWVGNYQGGFAYATADQHQKPGLTCHHLAIEFYRAEGRMSYDFLAGEDRYKSSLAAAQAHLHWLELTPRYSARNLALSAQRAARVIVTATRRPAKH